MGWIGTPDSEMRVMAQDYGGPVEPPPVTWVTLRPASPRSPGRSGRPRPASHRPADGPAQTPAITGALSSSSHSPIFGKASAASRYARVVREPRRESHSQQLAAAKNA